VKGTEGNFSFGMKEEEYMADFCLVSKRALEPLEYDIFRCHFLLGADWRLCCRRLKLDRGSFFHHLYRIEQKLGRVYRELQPHALFPLDEYFGGKSRKELPESYKQAVIQMPLPARGSPLRAPLKKVA
jgi:hypothetical protein